MLRKRTVIVLQGNNMDVVYFVVRLSLRLLSGKNCHLKAMEKGSL